MSSKMNIFHFCTILIGCATVYIYIFLACNHVTRRPCWWCVGGQYNIIFSRRIYMKIGFSFQRKEMLLFLTLTPPPTWPPWRYVQTGNRYKSKDHNRTNVVVRFNFYPFIFLCFKLIIINYYSPKQRKIKLKPNQNMYIHTYTRRGSRINTNRFHKRAPKAQACRGVLGYASLGNVFAC